MLFYNMYYSTQAQTSDKKPRTSSTLTPVTIKQLLDSNVSSDGKCMVDGRELGNIRVIGYIMNQNMNNTTKTYTITDNTGTIDVKQFFHEMDALNNTDTYKTYTYITVYGTYKPENRQVSAAKIVSIVDHNAITFHFLDAIHVHAKQTMQANTLKNDPYQQQQQQNNPYNNFNANTPYGGNNNNMNIEYNQQQQNNQFYNGANTGNNQDGQNFSACERAVCYTISLCISMYTLSCCIYTN